MIGFTRKYLQNSFDVENLKEADFSDTQAAFAFLLGQSAQDEGFVYKYTIDTVDRLFNWEFVSFDFILRYKTNYNPSQNFYLI